MTKRKFPKIGKLPNQPSKLIRLALEDLLAVTYSPEYEVDMAVWHEAFSNKCHVCLAGSVMAGLGADSRQDALPDDYPEGRALSALEYFRQGDVEIAFHYLGFLSWDGNRFNRTISKYENDGTAFFRDMEQLANDLEAEGW